ncbi:putative kinase [Silvibacterium bohemicum]|uniref:Putative kinase n=1 Tax=Silvibacterium bohemicum TaxID=1577686 RepID=A0A841JWB7_9BACT|nr:ATP-binding protein [Silvibacterium bohemicum]MBB6142738.1 putative kinase [Silvibacterium bohemicum]
MTVWVILAGLPGTGKSTLARALANRLGGAILDKDRVRQALFPGPLTDYTREQDDLCMRAIFHAAAYLTRNARAEFVFLDGRTYSRREQIDEAVSAAELAGAAWKILHVVCADSVAEQRLARLDAENPARNRNAALYREIKARFEEILLPHMVVDTTGGVDGFAVDAIVDELSKGR